MTLCQQFIVFSRRVNDFSDQVEEICEKIFETPYIWTAGEREFKKIFC